MKKVIVLIAATIGLLCEIILVAQDAKPTGAPATPVQPIAAAPAPAKAQSPAPAAISPAKVDPAKTTTPATATVAAPQRNIRFQFDGIPYPDVLERFAQMAN